MPCSLLPWPAAALGLQLPEARDAYTAVRREIMWLSRPRAPPAPLASRLFLTSGRDTHLSSDPRGERDKARCLANTVCGVV